MTKEIKSQILMYVQQIEHLPFENVEALKRRAKTLPHLKKYAMIVHDKDGMKSHVHLVLEFDRRMTISSVAKKIGDDSERFEIMTKRGNSLKHSEQNAFLYLIHRTKNSEGKYQYPIDKVESNFGYERYITKVEKAYQKKNLKPQTLVEQYRNGELNREEVLQKIYDLFPYQANTLIKKIDTLDQVKDAIEQDKWRTSFKDNKLKKTILWFYGDAGTGKTSGAKHILTKQYGEYFVSGGSRDVFENYNGQHGIILDDVRPNFLGYNDILKLLDPFDADSNVSARYHNKSVQGETYIITCPLDPYEFYDTIRIKSQLNEHDSFEQLRRRISLVVHFEKKRISLEKISAAFDSSIGRTQKTVVNLQEIENPLLHGVIDNLYVELDKLLKEYFSLDDQARHNLETNGNSSTQWGNHEKGISQADLLKDTIYYMIDDPDNTAEERLEFAKTLYNAVFEKENEILQKRKQNKE